MPRKKPISRILVSEDTLSLKECTYLIALYDRYSELSSSRDYTRRPLLHYYALRDVDSEAASWVYGVTLRCKKKDRGLSQDPAIVYRSVVRRVSIVGRITYCARGQ